MFLRAMKAYRTAAVITGLLADAEGFGAHERRGVRSDRVRLPAPQSVPGPFWNRCEKTLNVSHFTSAADRRWDDLALATGMRRSSTSGAGSKRYRVLMDTNHWS